MVCLEPKLVGLWEEILAKFFCSGSADTFFKPFLELKLLIESSRSLRDGLTAGFAFTVGLAFRIEVDVDEEGGSSGGGKGGALIKGIGGGGGAGFALFWFGKIVWDKLSFGGLFVFGFRIFIKKSIIAKIQIQNFTQL